jgi:hypothetical protein
MEGSRLKPRLDVVARLGTTEHALRRIETAFAPRMISVFDRLCHSAQRRVR